MAHKTPVSQQFNPKTLTAALSAIFAGIPAAYAQDAADQENQEGGDMLVLEEVMVTATKRGELSLQDVPMSITAFTNEDIKLQGFKRLDDYAGQIPSLSFGRREPGGTNVIMRGCAVSAVAFSENPTTSVYLDEQPISQSGFNPDPRLIDIERVEALSGPQGTLFGEASQCGTLRIITNKPDPTAFESYVDITGESVKGGKMGYDVNAMINIPLAQDTLALRLVGFTATDAGWVDNVLGASPGETYDNAPYVDKDVNSIDSWGARASLRWQPGENWVIDFQGIYQKTKSDGFGDIDINDGYYEDRDLKKWEQLRFGNESWDDEWYQLALTAEGSLGWADLVVTGGYAHRETRYLADSSAYIMSFQDIGDYWRETDPYLPRYDFGGDPHAFSIDDQENKRTSFEARLSSPSDSDSRWSWIGGIFYNKVEEPPVVFTANVHGLSDGCSADVAYVEGCTPQFTYSSYLHYYYFGTFDKLSNNWWHGVYNSTVKQKGIFGEFTFDITENLDITLGGRWYDIDTKRISRNGTLINPPQTTVMNCGTQADRDLWQIEGIPVSGFDTCYANESAKGSENGFVPKANITYRWDEDKLVYFTYSEGFRAGGANSGKRGTIYGADGEYHTYDSDNLINWEVGTKTMWAGGRFQFNFTFYHMIWEDIQIEVVNPDSNVYSVGLLNFPEAEINGFEADFSFIPAENWTLTATLAYNNAELSEDAILFPDGEDPKEALKGTRLPIVPDWKGSFLAEYTFTGELAGATPYLLGVYQYNGESVNSLDGIASVIGENQVRTHPSYSIVNLRYGLRGNNWSASFYVDNVFNEYSVTLYNDRWKQTRASTTRPRVFGINYSYTWN
jgi:iron complex outermembrane receptor protein